MCSENFFYKGMPYDSWEWLEGRETASEPVHAPWWQMSLDTFEELSIPYCVGCTFWGGKGGPSICVLQSFRQGTESPVPSSPAPSPRTSDVPPWIYKAVCGHLYSLTLLVTWRTRGHATVIGALRQVTCRVSGGGSRGAGVKHAARPAFP